MMKNNYKYVTMTKEERIGGINVENVTVIRRKKWILLCMLLIVVSTILPQTTVLANEPQTQEEIVESADVDYEVLDDETTVFDTCSVPMVASYEENAIEEKQVVNEVVVFIRFADESEDIYSVDRGGYDSILDMFNGTENSMKTYIDEYSWGQVEANTYVWPVENDGTPKCYVDPYPVSYYKKQTTSNPDGYTSSNKSSRRQTMLKNAIAFMGEDFLEQLGIEGQPYNLVFVVPDCGSWNDLLWSHKSSISVNGKTNVYNMITYPYKKNIIKTVTHEFMHSLGYKDLYRYYTDTSANPVSLWSIMASTDTTSGHPLVYEKNKYGKWIKNSDAIKTIKKSGHYELGPSTADPENNTIAYKIPVEGVTNQYFMVEYRGSSSSGYDTSLKREGLIFYRVNTKASGNSYGPPDELYVLREGSVHNAYYDGSDGKTEFSAFQLYDDTSDLGIYVYNIKLEDGYMSFDIEVPYLELEVSKEGPITVTDSTELVLSTDSFGEGSNYTFRFGAIVDGVEYELSGGYQSKNKITVNLLELLGNKVLGSHTLFVDVKNTSTGNVKRGTISDYVINGVNVSQIVADVASPQKVGTTIQLSALVENELLSDKNKYQFVVEKDGEEETLIMSDSYTAKWTPIEGGIYTIKYTVTDGYGLTASKEIQYPIGTDTTAYILYKNSSWNRAYIHYKVGSGTWTTAPGVKMSNTDVEGYSWIYLIDVGSKTAVAAFNNGNNTWDNNSEKNYTITAGVNSIGGTSKKLSSVTISADSVTKEQCDFSMTVKGGIAPYVCDYTIKNKADDSVIVEKSNIRLNTGEYGISAQVGEIGEYVLSVTIKDSYGQTISKEKTFELEGFSVTDIKASVDSPQLAGTEIVLKEKWKNADNDGTGIQTQWTIRNYTTGTIKEETVSDSDTLKWVPEEIGTYEITVKSTDASGAMATYTIYYSVVDKIVNNAIVYYGNSSWNSAYIHYRIGTGEWTTAPGVIMESSSEQSGYTWKFVIELGEETSATVCFNDGNNSWDSKNGTNYTVNVGTYGVKNSTVTKLTPIVTPMPIVTVTPTPLPTIAPTTAVTVAPTTVVTVTPTVTPIVTEAPTGTIAPTVTEIPEMTVTPTVTVTPIITVTPIPTVTKEPTRMPTATPTAVATIQPTVTEEPKITSTVTPTVTPVITEIPDEKPSITPTEGLKVTATPKPTEVIVTPEVEAGEQEAEEPKVGEVLWDNATKAEYKVISVGGEKAVAYVKAKSNAASITIPDTVRIDGKSYKVRKIASNSLKNNKKIKTVTIGKYVTTIEKSAFQGCTSLQKVKKGINVQNIGDKAFYGCKKLTSITMSSQLTTIGKQAFYKCTSLKKIIIPSKVKKIGTKAFYGCKKLKSITIKTKKLTVKNVGSQAFKGIYSKATIKVPESKTKAYSKMLKSKGVSLKAKIKK